MSTADEVRDADGYELCQCCGDSILPSVGGAMPEQHLCDDCGRGKCSRCLDRVRALWKSR